MDRTKDIERVKEALKEIGQIVDNAKAEDIWEEFSHDGFSKSWLITTDEGLSLYKEKVKNIESFLSDLTPEKVKKYNEPFIYFLLWILMVCEDNIKEHNK